MRFIFYRFRLSFIVFLFTFLFSCTHLIKNDRPKLVVIITLDQFRAGYLKRYDEVFNGGFRRLRDEDCRYDKAIVDHAPTLSWPGHTTIATGVYPKTHGISGNAFIVNKTFRQPFLFDRNEKIPGYPDAYGILPKRIRVTGIADWIYSADTEACTLSLGTNP